MTARTNIQHCFPELSDQQQQALVRSSMQEWGKTVFEMFVVWQRSFLWLEKKIIGEQKKAVFKKALAGDQGIILLAPHLGNWELLRIMSRYRAMTGLYQPPGDKALEDIVKKARSDGGMRLVPTNRRGIVALVKALRAGEMTSILPDQTPMELHSGIHVPFFGLPALTMTLVHKLLKTGSIAVMVAAKRVKGGFEVVYAEPDPEIYSEDQTVSVAALNRSVESLVRQFPEQYQWEYKRFKKPPEGEAKIYGKTNREEK